MPALQLHHGSPRQVAAVLRQHVVQEAAVRQHSQVRLWARHQPLPPGGVVSRGGRVVRPPREVRSSGLYSRCTVVPMLNYSFVPATKPAASHGPS